MIKIITIMHLKMFYEQSCQEFENHEERDHLLTEC